MEGLWSLLYSCINVAHLYCARGCSGQQEEVIPAFPPGKLFKEYQGKRKKVGRVERKEDVDYIYDQTQEVNKPQSKTRHFATCLFVPQTP